MPAITDNDRIAAEELRVLLADLSGFWHLPGDSGPICIALARHRELAERRVNKLPIQATPASPQLSVKAQSVDVAGRRHTAQPRRERAWRPTVGQVSVAN